MKRGSVVVEMIIWLVVTGVFFMLGSFLIVGAGVVVMPSSSGFSPAQLVDEHLDVFLAANALFLLIALGGPAWVVPRLLRSSRKEWFCFGRIDLRRWLQGMAVLVAIYPLMTGLEAWITEWLPSEWKESAQQDMLRRLYARILEVESPLQWMIRAVVIAAVPAVVEELYFRGLTQQLFIRWMRRPAPAILLSGLLFAALHMQWEGLAARWIIGALLGYIYWKTRNLWIPILIHLANNALVLTLGWGYHRGWFPWNPLDNVELPWYVVGLSGVGAIGLLYHFFGDTRNERLTDHWTKVYETGDPHWARIVEGSLQSMGVHAVAMNKRDSSYGFGFVELWVPAPQAEKARRLIRQIVEENA